MLTDGGEGQKDPPFPKICHTYPTMMKLGTVKSYLKKIQKIYQSRDTSYEFCWHQPFFYWKLANFAISRNTDIDWIFIHNSNSFDFSLVFNNCFLISKVTIWMMSAKMATPVLLKMKVFWKKGYDVIISDHDVTNKILSHDSNYIIDVVVWPKFGNCSISMRKVIITSILKGFYLKNHFFCGVVLVKVQ